MSREEQLKKLSGSNNDVDTYVDVQDADEKAVFNCKCPGCGAEMVYAPSKQLLECPFCGCTKNVDFSHKASEQDFSQLFKKQSEWSNTAVIECKNCGVKEVVSVKEIGKCCSFCGTPNVVKTNELAGLKPNAVIPFLITKDDAAEAVKKWGKKKFFATRKFKKNIIPEEINGIYDPNFTFDSDTESTYFGELGEYYYETRTVNGKTQRVRKVKYFRISGVYDEFFDDVLIEASKNIPQKFINQMSPFDTNNANDYDENFILGFSANQYNKDGKACWSDAQSVMRSDIRRGILSRYDYDVVRHLDVDTKFDNITYKYVLLPIYVGHCKYGKKVYNFFVNGKTGKVAGKIPLSVIKIMLVVLLALGLVIVLALMFLYSEGYLFD